MNNSLRREIILHIFKTIGIFADKDAMQVSMMEQLNGDKFLLQKKLAFENGEGNRKENRLWSASAKIENASINVIIADITEDIQEFTLIVRMDNFFPCAMRLSKDDADFGSMFVNVDGNKWIEASTNIQAKMLVGFESLSEIYLQWNRNDVYMDMYKAMVGFLNFYEVE